MERSVRERKEQRELKEAELREGEMGGGPWRGTRSKVPGGDAWADNALRALKSWRFIETFF